MKIALPAGWTVSGAIFVGALLWIGAQLPALVFGLVAKYAPAVMQAASASG